jgi:hypothetical protein
VNGDKWIVAIVTREENIATTEKMNKATSETWPLMDLPFFLLKRAEPPSAVEAAENKQKGKHFYSRVFFGYPRVGSGIEI